MMDRIDLIHKMVENGLIRQVMINGERALRCKCLVIIDGDEVHDGDCSVKERLDAAVTR